MEVAVFAVVPLFALMSEFGWVGTHLPLLIEPIGFVMSREMLLGIKERAEGAPVIDA